MTTALRTRVAIVGAGIGGLALSMRLIPAGVDHVLLEAGDGVGGTWRHNTYPGAACDVQSHLYSFADRPNPRWSRAYATQPEILAYLETCADESGAAERMRTGWTVANARWDAASTTWTLTSTSGEEVEADVVVFATGTFGAPRLAEVDGLEDFGGDLLHSARWDADVPLGGRRIGLIGTGASGIQILPEVVDAAARTTVFMRTPPYVLPRPDRPYSAEEQERFASDPAALAAVRQEIYRWFEDTVAYLDGSPAAAFLKGMALDHLRDSVPDPDLRARLTPAYELGCNRTLVSSDLYGVLQRDDVDLVTEPIARVVPAGVETADGTVHELDVIISATGFRVGEYLHGIEVVGLEGERLHDRWSPHPHAYLGMAVSGFPNLFVMYGPNTNQGANSIILVLEAQAQYISDAVAVMGCDGLAVVDVRRDVLDAYDSELQEAIGGTVWATGCRSYFIGAGGRVVTQMPYTSGTYAARTARFDVESYATTSAAQVEPST